MTHDSLRETIDAAFENSAEIGPETGGEIREAVHEALNLLDKGEARVAEKTSSGWTMCARSIAPRNCCQKLLFRIEEAIIRPNCPAAKGSGLRLLVP